MALRNGLRLDASFRMSSVIVCARTLHSAAHFTAIGAFQEATLGYFERDRKAYKKIPIKEQVEVLSLIGDVALIAHGHSLRVAGARWIGLPAAGGGLLKLGTATLSTLGFEHGNQVIDTWNAS